MLTWSNSDSLASVLRLETTDKEVSLNVVLPSFRNWWYLQNLTIVMSDCLTKDVKLWWELRKHRVVPMSWTLQGRWAFSRNPLLPFWYDSLQKILGQASVGAGPWCFAFLSKGTPSQIHLIALAFVAPMLGCAGMHSVRVNLLFFNMVIWYD